MQTPQRLLGFLRFLKRIGKNGARSLTQNRQPQEETEGEAIGPFGDNYPQSIALVLPGGFVTGGALQVGFLKALKEVGLLQRVKFISATSVGALNGAMAALGRIEELEKMWLELEARDVFQRKSILTLAYSTLAVEIAGKLNVLSQNKPPSILKLQKPYFSLKLLIATLAAGFVVTLPEPFTALSYWLIALGLFPAILLAKLIGGIFIRCLWLLIRWGSLHLLLKRCQALLHNPKLHSDSFNELSIERTVKNKMDLAAIRKNVFNGPVRLAVTVVNTNEWRLEVYAFGQESAQRIDTDAPETIDENLFEDIVFGSCAVPVAFPLRNINNDWYFDGGILKPNPLSYAYDADCDLIIAFGGSMETDKSRPVMIGQVIRRLMELEQHERFMREFQIASEKSRDISALQGLIANIKRAVSHFSDDPEKADRINTAVNNALASSKFSFRHDKNTPLIVVRPAWSPQINMELYGGYEDFSLIPDLIERGYRETMRVLRRTKIATGQ